MRLALRQLAQNIRLSIHIGMFVEKAYKTTINQQKNGSPLQNAYIRQLVCTSYVIPALEQLTLIRVRDCFVGDCHT